MLITKEIEIICNNNYYKKLGYNFNIGEKILIKIEDLQKGSSIKVLVKCDICGKEKEISYHSYNYNLNRCGFYSCSHKCANKKREITNIEKYGEINVFQNENIKTKSKQTKLEKYGDENYRNDDKRKETCIEKYGCESPLQDNNIRKKGYDTNLKKYGNKHPAKLNIFIEKTKQTKLVKYGNEYYINLEKNKKTCIEKYNVDNWMKSEDFKNNQIEKSSIKYDCNIINIDSSIYNIKCEKCGETFNININNLIKRQEYNIEYCTLCKPIGDPFSEQECNLKNFIENNYNDRIIYNNRNLIKPKEIDIYLPELNLAFEFNGLYWHNELFKENNYHLNKTEMCEKQGIKLIQIYQDDWLFKQDIVKSRILNLLGKSEKIYARKCEIKEINDNKLIRTFLENNHLQGFVGSKIKIGLFYNEELVSLMTFGSYRKAMGQKSINNSYEMLRFCNELNTNVIGGASRLFKYFIEYYKPKEVISYADRSWSNGNLYEKLGFKFISKTQPNYYYIIDSKRKYRFNYRKDKLVKDGADPNKTEHEIMLERKIYRIYDSGNLKFKY